MKRKEWAVLLSVALFAAASIGVFYAWPHLFLLMRLEGRTVYVLRGATRLQVFRVDPRDFRTSASDTLCERFCGYRIIHDGLEPDAAFARRAAQMILDPANYELIEAKANVFQPSIGLRFWRSGEHVDLLLNHESLALQVGDPSGAGQRGQITVADLELGRGRFFQVPRTAFPNNPLFNPPAFQSDGWCVDW